LSGETGDPVARVGDLHTVVSVLGGKVEFEQGEEGREVEVLEHLLRTAIAETYRSLLGGAELSGFSELVTEGRTVETGDLVPAEKLLEQVGTIAGLAQVLDRLGLADATAGRAASGVEFVLESLHLTRRLDKLVLDDGRTVYGS
jgi:magnesium chelatase subunit I